MRRILAVALAMLPCTGLADTSTVTNSIQAATFYDSGCETYSITVASNNTNAWVNYIVNDYCHDQTIGRGEGQQLPASVFTDGHLVVNFTNIEHEGAALIADLTWVPNNNWTSDRRFRRVTTDKLDDGTTRREVVVSTGQSNTAEIMGSANIFPHDALANGGGNISTEENTTTVRIR